MGKENIELSFASPHAFSPIMGGGRATLWQEARYASALGRQIEIIGKPQEDQQIPDSYLIYPKLRPYIAVPVLTKGISQTDALYSHLTQDARKLSVPIVHLPWEEIADALKHVGRSWIFMPHMFELTKEAGMGNFSFGESWVMQIPSEVWLDVPHDLFILNLKRTDVEQEMIEAASCVILPTENERQKALDLFPTTDPKKFHVIYPGIDHQRFNPTVTSPKNTISIRRKIGVPEDAFVFGMVNRADPVKNIDKVIREFAEVVSVYKNRSQPLYLVIFGLEFKKDSKSIPASYTQYLINLIEQLGERLPEKVNFRDRVRLLPYTQATDAFAAIGRKGSLINHSRHESASLATLEAMACGVACIVRGEDYGGAYELTGGTQLCSDGEDGLKKQMIEAVENEKLRTEASHAAIAQAKKFSWEDHTKQVIDLADRLREGQTVVYESKQIPRAKDEVLAEFSGYLEWSRQQMVQQVFERCIRYNPSKKEKSQTPDQNTVAISKYAIINDLLNQHLPPQAISALDKSYIMAIDERIDQLNDIEQQSRSDTARVQKFIDREIGLMDLKSSIILSYIVSTREQIMFMEALALDNPGENLKYIKFLAKEYNTNLPRYYKDLEEVNGWVKKLLRWRRELNTA